MLKKKLSSQKTSIGMQSSSEESLTLTIGQNEQEETGSDVEERVVQYEQRLGQPLPLHNKEVLREMIKKEDAFWERWDVRVDNYKYHDDY